MLILPPHLVEATPKAGYVVFLRFEDGLEAEVDFSYLLDFGGVFEPLRDVEYFRKLQIDEFGISIAWPNEADIAPETLYDHVQRAVYEGKLRRAAAQRN